MTSALLLFCLSALIYLNEGFPKSKNGHKVSDFSSRKSFTRRYTHEDGEPLTKFTKEEIDEKYIDENSELEILLESMSCQGSKAIGIHPELKQVTQALLTEEENEDNLDETKRNFVSPTKIVDGVVYKTRWKNAVVPFVVDIGSFDDKYHNQLQKTVNEAIEEYRRKTCVELQQKTEEEIEKEHITHYVLVFNDRTGKRKGCNSRVGLELWKEPYIKLHLQQDKCLKTGTVVHEFGHALGMSHEQSRSDRDDFIWIDFENVKEGAGHNFKQRKTIDVNPYDYSSVMQYHLKGFAAKSWKNTFHFLNPELEFLAGQRVGLSFYDVMDVTKAYNCSKGCDVCKECLNGGFAYHTCECYCPEGLTGDQCELISSAKEKCGDIVELELGQSVTITSPNYPDNYDVGKICYWQLRARNPDHRVMIEFEDFEVSSNDHLGRCYHWLEVRYNLVAQPGPKYCCTPNMRNKISTTKFGNSHMMMLIFDTATVSGAEPSRGFKIKAHAVEPKGCSDPPSVPNSVINDDYLSLKNEAQAGDIIAYECEDNYQVVGERFVTCEADGTWTVPRFYCVKRDPIFECSFNNGDDCGIQQSKRKYQWKLKEKDGNGFLTIEPEIKDPATTTFIRFAMKPKLKADKTYCLEMDFRRYNDNDGCAAMYVGNYDIKYYPWKYKECQKMDWTHFKGDFGPLKHDMHIQFIGKTYSGHHTFNMDIDNIKLREGSC